MRTKVKKEKKSTIRTRTTTKKKAEKESLEKKHYIEAIGRRKEAVARVRFIKSQPGIIINEKPLTQYFPLMSYQNKVLSPFSLSEDLAKVPQKFLLSIKVKGGGLTGQAEAIRLGISRCLVKINESWKPLLRKAGYLTRDARVVERKKYGRKKARKRPQWSKR